MIKRIKTLHLYFLLAGVILLVRPSIAHAKAIEKGNPVAYYDYDRIILSDDTVIDIDTSYIALFINGTLVPDYEVIIRESRALVPIRLISQELGSKVDWDGKIQKVTVEKGANKISITINNKKAVINGKELLLDCPAVIYKDLTYVPLRFIVENLDGLVVYAKRLDPDYTYYYDTQMPVSPADTIIREFPNIMIDEKESLEVKISQDQAMEEVKRMCTIGLENFKRSLKQNLIESDEEADRFDDVFISIEKEISRMIYLGEVSRYHKFTIGAYDILFDKYNQNMLFVMYSSGIIVKAFDPNDPALFVPIFIVG
ncbi:MAG TPA: hypothetical protein GX707_16865 [Epulopiscium sp.]|nr:hypothetical protein [Candidatus Epulonipiscium sp.]